MNIQKIIRTVTNPIRRVADIVYPTKREIVRQVGQTMEENSDSFTSEVSRAISRRQNTNRGIMATSIAGFIASLGALHVAPAHLKLPAAQTGIGFALPALASISKQRRLASLSNQLPHQVHLPGLGVKEIENRMTHLYMPGNIDKLSPYNSTPKASIQETKRMLDVISHDTALQEQAGWSLEDVHAIIHKDFEPLNRESAQFGDIKFTPELGIVNKRMEELIGGTHASTPEEMEKVAYLDPEITAHITGDDVNKAESLMFDQKLRELPDKPLT